MSIVYINGQYVTRQNAMIGAEDRAASFGDGVYEVILIKQGCMIDEKAHEKRLERSLGGLQMDAPMAWNAIKLIIRRLLRLNHLLTKDVALYLQVSRGEAKRDHPFPVNITPSLFISVSPAKFLNKSYYEKGASAITTEDIRWLRRDIKSTSLLPNVLAKQQAAEANVAEAILIEKDGTVTEGSSSNLFLVNDAGELLTHPADRHILNGITRMGVIAVAKEQGVKVREERYHEDMLRNAKELFITSTTKHILPITFVDGKPIYQGEVGEVTSKLISAYKNFIDAQKELSCKVG